MTAYRSATYVDRDRPDRELDAVRELGRWRVQQIAFGVILCGVGFAAGIVALFASAPHHGRYHHGDAFPAWYALIYLWPIAFSLVYRFITKQRTLDKVASLAAKYDVSADAIAVPDVMRQ